jgi:tryptophan-rich sensory protein
MKGKHILILIACVLGTLAIGGISGYFTSSAITGWYTTIQKPSFNPPNYLFGPVWTILYALMGFSLYKIITSPSSESKTKAYIIFGVQLTLNFFWSIIFFNLQQPGFALIEIVVLWGFILGMIITFRKIDRTAGLIQIPYLLWVSFATLLNASIWWLNK